MIEMAITESGPPACPRCEELRGRTVVMHTIKAGSPDRGIKTAYECPSCDYSIPLVPFPEWSPKS